MAAARAWTVRSPRPRLLRRAWCRRCKCTVASDRKHLLNALVLHHERRERENDKRRERGVAVSTSKLAGISEHKLKKELLEREPPSEHPAYAEANRLVTSRMAPEALERALLEGRETFEKVMRKLRSSHVAKLHLCLREAKDTRSFEDVVLGLPDTLEVLELTLPDRLYKQPRRAYDAKDIDTWKDVRPFEKLIKLGLRQESPTSPAPSALADKPLLTPADIIGRLVGYAHGESLIACPVLEYVDLSHFEELTEVPWQLFEIPSIKTINCTLCTKIEGVGCQFPLIASGLSALILDGCSALATLPEALAKKCENLTELGLANCTALGELPRWVNEIERKGAGVIRPSHLA